LNQNQEAAGTTSKIQAKNQTRSARTSASQSTRQCVSIPMPHLRQKSKQRLLGLFSRLCCHRLPQHWVWVLFSHNLSLLLLGELKNVATTTLWAVHAS